MPFDRDKLIQNSEFIVRYYICRIKEYKKINKDRFYFDVGHYSIKENDIIKVICQPSLLVRIKKLFIDLVLGQSIFIKKLQETYVIKKFIDKHVGERLYISPINYLDKE